MTRTCIYPKDIQQITGRSERQSRHIVAQIKKNNNKEKHQFITVEEFMAFSSIKLEVILPYLK